MYIINFHLFKGTYIFTYNYIFAHCIQTTIEIIYFGLLTQMHGFQNQRYKRKFKASFFLYEYKIIIDIHIYNLYIYSANIFRFHILINEN